MELNNLNNFDELKIFIDSILKSNLKNNNYMGSATKILDANIEDNTDEITDTVNY